MTRGYIDDALLLVPGTNYEYFGNEIITYATPDRATVGDFIPTSIQLDNVFDTDPSSRSNVFLEKL